MRDQNRQDLTQGPIGRTLFVFALPILAGNVLQSLNGSINAVWVGRFLGEQALTATANANNIMFFLIGAVFGVGMAATILVAQAIGAKDMPQARRVIGTSVTSFFTVSLVIALGGLPLARQILVWMDTPADALPLAEAYLRIIFFAGYGLAKLTIRDFSLRERAGWGFLCVLCGACLLQLQPWFLHGWEKAFRIEGPGYAGMGQERSQGVAILRRFLDIPFLPIHFDFLAPNGAPLMSVERKMSVGDRYRVSVPDQRLDFRVAAAVAVGLDALMAR